MNPSSSETNENHNLIETIEQFQFKQHCPLHPGSEFRSICFGSNASDKVFHCEKCEIECNSGNSHVQLCLLTHSVDKECVIKNWPAIDNKVLERTEAALSLTFEEKRESDIETIKKLKYQQIQIQQTYNKCSLQKEFRDVIMSDQYTFEEKSNELIRLIIFAKEHKKQIEEELRAQLSIHFDLNKSIIQMRIQEQFESDQIVIGAIDINIISDQLARSPNITNFSLNFGIQQMFLLFL